MAILHPRVAILHPRVAILHPRVVNVVQLRSEMIKQDLNIVFYFFWGGGEGGGVFLTAYAFKSFILIRTRHGNFCSKL